MGLVTPAQILRDVREHGVEVRAIDVNVSDWDCGLEAHRESRVGLALRLGFRLVSGLRKEEVQMLLRARRLRNGAPFASVGDAAQRSGISRRTLEVLAAADVFDGAGIERRKATWDAGVAADHIHDLPLFAVGRDRPEAALEVHSALVAEPEPNLP